MVLLCIKLELLRNYIYYISPLDKYNQKKTETASISVLYWVRKYSETLRVRRAVSFRRR